MTVASLILDKLITSIETAPTRAERAAIWAGVIDIRDPDQPGVAPGFDLDYAPGIYWNGWALYAVASDGSTAYRDRQSWSERMTEVWSEIEQHDRDQRKLAAWMSNGGEPVRRPVGRPAIGDPRQVRFPEWLDRLVTWYADEHGISAPEAIRRLVMAGLHAEAASPVDELSQMVDAGQLRVVDVHGPRGGRS